MGDARAEQLAVGDWVRTTEQVGGIDPGALGRIVEIVDPNPDEFGHHVRLLGRGVTGYSPRELQPYQPTEDDLYEWSLAELRR